MLDWLTGLGANSEEGYYTSLVQSLFEEKYIEYTWDETLPDTLEFFEKEAERIIREDSDLFQKYTDHINDISVPEELKFLKPYISLVGSGDNVDSFSQIVPKEFIDLTERMLNVSSDLRKNYFKKSKNENSELLFRINLLEEAGSRYIYNLFRDLME